MENLEETSPFVEKLAKLIDKALGREADASGAHYDEFGGTPTGRSADLTDMVFDGRLSVQNVAEALASVFNKVHAEEPTPEMLRAGWAVLNKHKKAARVWKMGPGPGLTEVYQAMQAVAPKPELSPELRRLIIAARVATDQGLHTEADRELLEAVEAFSELVPYEEQPDELRIQTKPSDRMSYDTVTDVLYVSLNAASVKPSTIIESKATVLWRFDEEGGVSGVTIDGAEHQELAAREKNDRSSPSDGEIYSLASFKGDKEARNKATESLVINDKKDNTHLQTIVSVAYEMVAAKSDSIFRSFMKDDCVDENCVRAHLTDPRITEREKDFCEDILKLSVQDLNLALSIMKLPDLLRILAHEVFFLKNTIIFHD